MRQDRADLAAAFADPLLLAFESVPQRLERVPHLIERLRGVRDELLDLPHLLRGLLSYSATGSDTR